MATIIHFIDVGQGNMVLIETANGKKIVFDCNITEENQRRVIGYLVQKIGQYRSLDAFICSHRDADHMRGVKKLNTWFPIKVIRDSDYPGTTTDSSEYKEYMELRRRIGGSPIKKQTYMDYGRTRFRYLSAKDDRLSTNANAQGIVIKVEHRSVSNDRALSSAILPADSDAQTWKKGIMVDYRGLDVSSSILMAGHHGSTSFFDDPDDTQYYYTTHIRNIKPYMTIISVGENSHGHPDKNAVELYEKYSTGSQQGNKVYRTDHKGTMKLVLKDEGGWSLTTHQ